MGAKKRGVKGGLQNSAGKVGCNEGVCNGGVCKKAMQCGVAVGGGARRGAKMDARKRGGRGGCKSVLEQLDAWRVFAMGGIGM